MSTKIYNGFKCNSLSAMMQKELICDLKAKLISKYEEAYYQVFAEKSLDFIDQLSIMDQEEDFGKLKTALQTYYQEQCSIDKALYAARYGDVQQIEDDTINNAFAHYTTIKTLFVDILAEDMRESEIHPTIMNDDTYFKTTLVVLPLNKSKMLLMTYPNAFTNILLELISTDKAFANKYGLEEYHYQDQTDKPNSISSAQWAKRKKDWDEALPSGIPSKDGICINLIDSKLFSQGFLFKKFTKNVFNLYPSRTERVDKLAQEKAFDTYYEMNIGSDGKNDHYTIMLLEREYRKKLAENDAEAQDIFDKAWSRVNGCLPEITEEDLTKKKILDWFPNYKKTLNLE